MLEQHNHPSVDDTLSQVAWDKLMNEVNLNRVAGPFPDPPFRSYIQSPLGLVPKAGQPGKFRLIFDLSAPDPAWSVNGQTPPELCSVHYRDFDDAVLMVQKLGEGAFMSKTDLEAAFRQLPIRPQDWPLLVMKMKSPVSGTVCYFVDLHLPFESSMSCSIF